MTVPHEIRTARSLLRAWRVSDAAALHPILVANWEHLSPWIPRRVADPASVPEIEERLASFAADFVNDLKWRYAMLTADGETILGEIDLFPRNANDRVVYGESDRAEIGYWVRRDMTGRGLVTEGVETIMAVARGLSRIARLEIRCDAANVASSAIPKKLGFTLEQTLDEPPSGPEKIGAQLQIWALNSLTSTA